MEDSGDKSGKGVGGSTRKKEAVSRTVKAGLKFPVGWANRYLRKWRYGKPVGQWAPIYLAAVIQYIAAELLELAGNAARESNNSVIHSRHVELVLRKDEDLAKLVDIVSVDVENEMITQFCRMRVELDDGEAEDLISQLSRFQLDGNDGVSASS